MRLTQEQLKNLLHYEPSTGVFTWCVSRGRARAGETAGNVDSNGHLQIKIFGIRYGYHRLAWLYMTGEWPKDQIDHINGVRNDNRWVNLREATRSINLQNQRKPHTNNITGFLGVSQNWDRFNARIELRGKAYYLGSYATPEQAHEAYLQAKRRMHGGCTI